MRYQKQIIMTKVWFITGSSRGLGRSITEAVLASGDKVAATARKPEQLQALKEQYGDNVLLLPLDVTDKVQINNAVEQIVQQFGRIDVLVNNAGFGIIGAAEALPPSSSILKRYIIFRPADGCSSDGYRKSVTLLKNREKPLRMFTLM